MREFIYSLMTDKADEAVFRPVKWVLYILSLGYRVGIRAREIFYKTGIFNSRRVPLKVISVGNLALGGTGKTPFVIALAKILKNELEKEPAILIRGYGWDEQAMLKSNLADLPVFVGEDRIKSAHRAIKLYGTEVAVLDDGFQHWEMARDLDIVLIDSRNPFGNGFLFPRGILREPKEAIGRAGIVVFTKVNKKKADLREIRNELICINSSLHFLEAVHKPVHLYDVKAKIARDLSFAEGRRVVCLSSIGDPGYFEETVRDLGADVVEHIVFPDHHNYSHKDAEDIMRRCRERFFDFLITTEKDAVKLNRKNIDFADLVMTVLAIEMEITSGREILIDRLNGLFTGQAS